MPDITPDAVLQRYRRARDRRANWEPLWQECFDFALPQRELVMGGTKGAGRKTDRLFDGTAPDAVDQLAASLLAQLTPPWARWFGLMPGSRVDDAERSKLSGKLETTAQTLQSHFDRSNFAVEMHQCYLDLVTAGTACLMFESASPGEPSAFRFTAIPLSQVAFEEDSAGRLDTTFRTSRLTRTQILERFPKAKLPDELKENSSNGGDESSADILEAVVPAKGGFDYIALIDPGAGSAGSQSVTVLKTGRFDRSPFINFRWLKAPGEIYGRSPVMKTLPDIKTANKVVELVLKNASIAVTGIWQADDDGVLNPANIRLTPGTIIPKAVGSAGLRPLEAPGRFDMSQVVLQDLRAGIRRALLADRLGQVDGPRMTATEVLERVAEVSRLLGATYGRLQSELLTPMITRGLTILTRRGEIPALRIDGQTIDLEYKSPLARHQAQQDVQSTLAFLDGVARLGPQAMTIIDVHQVAQALATAFGVPPKILKPIEPSSDSDPASGARPIVDVASDGSTNPAAGLAALASVIGASAPPAPMGDS